MKKWNHVSGIRQATLREFGVGNLEVHESWYDQVTPAFRVRARSRQSNLHESADDTVGLVHYTVYKISCEVLLPLVITEQWAAFNYLAHVQTLECRFLPHYLPYFKHNFHLHSQLYTSNSDLVTNTYTLDITKTKFLLQGTLISWSQIYQH